MRWLVYLCAGILCACEAEDGRSASQAPQPVQATASANPYSASLVGEYRVEALDGRKVELGHEEGASVTILPERISYKSQCVYGNWT